MSPVALLDNFSNKIGEIFGKTLSNICFYLKKLSNNTISLILGVIETKHITSLVTRIQNMLISLSVTLFVILWSWKQLLLTKMRLEKSMTLK